MRRFFFGGWASSARFSGETPVAEASLREGPSIFCVGTAGSSLRFAGTIGGVIIGSAEVPLEGVDATVRGTELWCAIDWS